VKVSVYCHDVGQDGQLLRPETQRGWKTWEHSDVKEASCPRIKLQAPHVAIGSGSPS
jgi:hypothetical protein